MHLIDDCQFLNCSVRMGGGVWSGTVRYEFTTYFMGERRGNQQADPDPYLWLVFQIREAKKHVDPVDPDPKH
jgi:hypothetical protein